ncbi:methyl-CpG-binding protein 2-like [Halichondria panicea]|uniref:methyl-CpG-binding protein 2-like n=1 Tax=Halichondria panicea TaxID=6063 RepID=UPI00312BC3D0
MTSLPSEKALSDAPQPNVPSDLPPSLKIKGLPAGWRREVVVRKNGQSAGKTDVYYYSPCGKKFRSKPQIARFLGDCTDLSAFDFSRAGTPGDGTQRRRARDRTTKKVEMFRSMPLVRPLTNNPLRPSGPIRRTCGVIKLPVIHVRVPSPSVEDGKDNIANSPDSCAKEGILPDTPKSTPLSPIPITTSSGVAVPALWENRLLGVKACDYETGDDIIPPPKTTQNGTSNNRKLSESTLNLLTTTAGTTLSHLSSLKSPLSSPGGKLSTSLLAQQLQQSLKQAVGLSNMSVIPSLLQRSAGRLSSSIKNGQSKDSVLLTLNKNSVSKSSGAVRMEGKQMIENLSKMVTDSDLRLQEEKVKHLRQQLMAAEQK